jgi:CDP-glucose 4,6-dehydratase
VGEGARWQLDPNPQPHEAHYLKLDCAKAKTRLGWSPRWPLAEAIRRIVAWQQALHAGADMRAWSLAEIAEYIDGGKRQVNPAPYPPAPIDRE